MKKIVLYSAAAFLIACGNPKTEENKVEETSTEMTDVQITEAETLLEKYVTVKLSTDVSKLSENHRKMIPLLIDVAKIMDELFWVQAYGDKAELKAMVTNDAEWRFAEINYGPWDRLNGNIPFVEGVGEKPLGANYYPTDMTKAEFEAVKLDDKASLYTFLRRDSAGNLMTVPFHVKFEKELQKQQIY